MPASHRFPVLIATLLVAMLGACTPPTSDGGEVVRAPDDRIDEVLAARAALLDPVPLVTAEAERSVGALEELWLVPVAEDRRAAAVASVTTDELRAAAEALAAVELEGEGPDVQATQAAVATLVDDARALSQAIQAELDGLAELAAFDEQLGALPARWDEPGQYSQQLAAFEQLAADARELADEAAGRTALPACTEVWERRRLAAETVADRTDELRPLIRDRRGQEFDELRDEYRQDPFGLGARLADLDAEAAAACWAEGSAAPELLAAAIEARDDVAGALDPEDL